MASMVPLDDMAKTDPNFSFYQKVCRNFYQQEKDIGQTPTENSECECGRKKKLHTEADNDRVKPFSPKEVNEDGRGQIFFDTHNPLNAREFQRLADCEQNGVEETVDFMLNEWKLGKAEKSQIIISVHGEKVNSFDKDLQDIMANCIIETVQNSQGMVITSGQDWSIAFTIGHWKMMKRAKMSCIGVGSWGGLNKQLEMEQHLDEKKNEPFEYGLTMGYIENDLNAGHTHFLLYCNGTTKRIEEFRLQELRVKLLEAMKKKDNLPVQILFGSSVPHTVDLFTLCISNEIPLVLCYGFGGIVDAIAKFVIGKKCGATDDVNNDRLLGDLKKHFGESEGLKKQIQLLDMYAQNDQEQIVVEVYDIHKAGFVNFERTILDAADGSCSKKPDDRCLNIYKIAMECNLIETYGACNFVSKIEEELVKDSCTSDTAAFLCAFFKRSRNTEEFRRSSRMEEIRTNTNTKELLVRLYQHIDVELRKWRQQPIDNLIKIKQCLGNVLKLPEEFLTNLEYPTPQSFLVWAILGRRWSVANVFLQEIFFQNTDIVTSSLASALVCKRVCKQLFDGELHAEYKSKCVKFEKLAIRALDYVYLEIKAKPKERWECVKYILKKKSEQPGRLDALEVAMEGDFTEFMGCDTIYRWMQLRWTGEEQEAPHVGNGKRFDVSPRKKFYIHGIFQVLFAVLWIVFSQLDVHAEEYKVLACILFPWTLLHEFGQIRLQRSLRTMKRWSGVIHIEARHFVVCLPLLVVLSAFILLNLEKFQHARILYGVVTAIIVLELLLFLKKFRPFASQLISIENSVYQIIIFSILIALLCLAFLPIITGALCLTNSKDIGDMTFKLYLFIFSEMSFDVQDDTKCRDGEDSRIFSYVIVYCSLAIFLLIGNIMLLNLLVAMMEAVTKANEGRANVLWKMSRLRLYIGFREQTITVAPFNIFELIIRKCIGYTRRGQSPYEPVPIDQPDGRNDAKQVFNDKIRQELANKFVFPAVRGEDKDSFDHKILNCLQGLYDTHLKVYK